MIRATNDDGEVRFLFRSSLVLARYTLEVLSDGVTLASLPVTTPPVAARPQEQTPVAARPAEPGEDEPGAGEEEAGAGRGDDAVSVASEIARRMELAEQALENGEAETAVRLYEGVVSLAPDDAEAWFRMGLALAAADETAEARAAYQRAAELEPERADQVAAQLALLRPLPPWLQLDLWGGAEIQTGETRGDVMVEASLWPLSFLRIWARYDDGLGLRNPFFVRRTRDLESYYGGVELAWGKSSRLLTSVEVGRRNHATELFQYVYHAQQAIRIPGAGSEIAFGGYLGRWFDRDDWVGYARADLRVTPEFAVRPSVYVGETVTALGEPATALDATRLVENEVRGYLGLAFRPIGPLEIEPVLGIGSVDSPAEDLSGSLLEGHFRLSADLGATSRFQIFVRHQRPPGGDSFTTLAAGLVFGVSRGGPQP
jgi:tetratricopeptide (TPR) repeat protein